jgi:divalent metal cation (Fe/Co/Zn/Cd) transporter
LVTPSLPSRPPDTTGDGLAQHRQRLLATALHLSVASVITGLLLGGLSITVGILEHSLGVLGTGLGLVADVGGSIVLIWRFRLERSHPHHADRVEARAALLVSGALGVIAIVLAVDSIRALLERTHPGSSVLSLVAAGLAVSVLSPLAGRKRRTALALGSHALRGDSTLTAIGALTSLLAVVGLVVFRAFGWWWADRVVALLVACLAAAESRSLARSRPAT